jgi:hypothetical protein
MPTNADVIRAATESGVDWPAVGLGMAMATAVLATVALFYIAWNLKMIAMILNEQTKGQNEIIRAIKLHRS